MAYAQAQFDSFHKTILYGYDSSEELRKRRDTLLEDLKEHIDPEAPPYETFYQGSYELDTGVHPIDGNPDMDIGVLFDCTPKDYPDPLTLKKYVRNALDRMNRTLNIKRPCVTVTYMRDGDPLHHIDLAVYCKTDAGVTQLAWCRETTACDEREWRESEARELSSTIKGRFDGKNKDQYRRCIRALKRWRDCHIGHKNTPSIGLTVAAYKWFEPDFDAMDGKYRDLSAIRRLVQSMLNNWGSRLYIYSPVAPYADMLERMTDTQMSDFKEKLIKLRDALVEVENQPDTHEACKILRKQFGDDFPVPDKTETTKSTDSGVVSTGRSA